MSKKFGKSVIEKVGLLRDNVDNLPLESLENVNYMVAWLEKLSEDLEKVQESLEAKFLV